MEIKHNKLDTIAEVILYDFINCDNFIHDLYVYSVT